MEKKTSTILREPAVRRDAANLERPLGRSLLWRGILHLVHVTSFFLPPPSTTCATYIESKTNRDPSREGPLSQASLRPPAGVLGQADLILPSLLPSFTFTSSEIGRA